MNFVQMSQKPRLPPARRKRKRADYILSVKPNIPVAVIEAKDNNHSVGDGMQQALDYADTLLPGQ